MFELPEVSGYISRMLDCVEIETAPNPDAAVIWLHGLGADAADFEPIVPQLAPERGRAWRFVFPNAPVRPVTINGGMPMRAWYDIKGLDRRSAEDVAGFSSTDAQIRELVARESQRGVATSRMVLAGFSQGGAMSLYAMPRFPQALAGVVALSCYLPRESVFAAERLPHNDTTPVFMAHGRSDPVVPFQMAQLSRDFLIAQGYAVEWHEYPMPHSLCPAEVADIRAFLLRVLR